MLPSASLGRSPVRPEQPRRRSWWLGACLFFALTSGCSSAGQYVWYSQLPRADWGQSTGEYVIGLGDTVTVRVYEQEGLSGSFKVRSDGRVAVPLAGEFVLAGKHPSEVARDLETRLKAFVVQPHVTVNVEESRPITVSTLGEVTTKGVLTLEPPARLIQALAQSGGLTDFADDGRIFVLRQFPKFQRIRFTYEAIVNNTDGAANFPLRTGDVIVVE